MTEDEIFELAELLADEAFDKKGVIYYSERQELTSIFNKMLVKKLILPSVSITLPALITEDHNIEWMAYLEGVGGVVATGDTEKDAVNGLMVLIKIKLLYDKGN